MLSTEKNWRDANKTMRKRALSYIVEELKSKKRMRKNKELNFISNKR